MTQTRIPKPTTRKADEAVDELPAVEPADTADTDELLDTIDAAVAAAERTTDELLLGTALAERPATVKAGTAIPTVRAWMMGGRVD